jgi:PAS domain S-box-containing protein
VLLAIAGFILILIVLFSLLDWREFSRASVEIDTTQQILEHTGNLLSAVTDAETGQRGFLLTGEERYLEPYRRAAKEAPEELTRLAAFTSGRHRQSDRVEALRSLVAEKLQELADTIDLRRSAGFQAALDLVLTDRGRKAMDDIRRLCGAIEREEYAGLTERSRQAQTHGSRTRLITTAGSAFLFVFLMLAAMTIERAAERQRQLITQLEASRKETADILESITDGFAAVDGQWLYTYVNSAGEVLIERRRAELLGRPLWNTFPEARAEASERELRQAMQERKAVEFETYSEGPARWMLQRAYPTAAGGLAIYFRDITETKRAQEQSRLNEERFRVAIGNSPIMVFNQDRRLRYTWAYNTHRAFADGGAEGKTDDDLAPPEIAQRLKEVKQRILDSGVGSATEITLPIDGGVHTYQLTLEPLRDSAGAIEGITGAAFDITERKAFEDELRAAYEALQRSASDLQQFAYAASHDLKEPLRMVRSYVELLRRRFASKLGDEAQQFIGYASEGAVRMEALLEALLEYSRLGAVAEQPAAMVSSETALRDALENLRLSIDDSGASVTHDQMPEVMAHDLYLQQLFQNLVSNALKYRSAAPPEIHVGAERKGAEWIFSVRDNGIGIDPRYFTQIFGIFKRLHGSEYSGTGIGLAACHRIVQLYGGRIWVESALGAGSTFYFSLPAGPALTARGKPDHVAAGLAQDDFSPP